MFVCVIRAAAGLLWLISGSAEGWYIGTAASPASRPNQRGKRCIDTAALNAFSSCALLWCRLCRSSNGLA
jgi:hypothetical protein